MSQPMPLPSTEPQAHPRGKRLPRKYAQVVFLFFMTLCMCLTQSMVTTARYTGFGEGFLLRWANTFVHAYIVVIPVVTVVVPIARRITRRLVEE
jgi:uncharacterized membrane protein